MLPQESCEFATQLLDVAHEWSCEQGDQSFHSDLAASAAGIYSYFKLHPVPEEPLHHALPALCWTFGVPIEDLDEAVSAVLDFQARVKKQRLCIRLTFELAVLARP